VSELYILAELFKQLRNSAGRSAPSFVYIWPVRLILWMKKNTHHRVPDCVRNWCII